MEEKKKKTQQEVQTAEINRVFDESINEIVNYFNRPAKAIGKVELFIPKGSTIPIPKAIEQPVNLSQEIPQISQPPISQPNGKTITKTPIFNLLPSQPPAMPPANPPSTPPPSIGGGNNPPNSGGSGTGSGRNTRGLTALQKFQLERFYQNESRYFDNGGSGTGTSTGSNGSESVVASGFYFAPDGQLFYDNEPYSGYYGGIEYNNGYPEIKSVTIGSSTIQAINQTNNTPVYSSTTV